jgi:hypothetical protein
MTEPYIINQVHGFTSEDVASCEDFKTLCEWSMKNSHTIASIKIQMIEYSDEEKRSKAKKQKALTLVNCLQHMIETRLREMEYYKLNNY